ncbi:hypothetical protein PybrP1_001442 [[Pythium] brassicae (nom. inval.)]|nr:hypothetical protein PybrP1_001442 [[Pythium] brassicae (nom. inval.)]
MAGKKRKHGGGAASARLKTIKKKHADGAATVAASDDILTPELRAELGGVDGDVLVVVGRKAPRVKAEVVPEELVQQAARMSKTKRRKLEHLAARKVKEARREDLYKSLEASSLSNDQLNLMLTTSKLGHKETLRERLKRSMNKVKAGLELSAEDQQELLQQRATLGTDAGNAGSDSDSDSEADSDSKADTKTSAEAKADGADAAATAPPQRATAKKHKKASTGASSSDESARTSAAPAPPSEHQSAATGNKPTKQQQQQQKKRKKRVAVVTRLEPQQTESDVEEAGSNATVTVTVTATVASALPQLSVAFERPDEDASPGSERPLTSQNAAMAKLEALRQKNEERRRQRELAKRNPAAAAAAEPEPPVDPASMYVPTPIVLKTSAEMRALSQHTPDLRYKTTLVQLTRKPEIQLARMQLPVCSSEQEIMEAITANDVVILCGETGSGKTTQVPQFLYEAGFGHPAHPQFRGRIGVTQPRRVAAVSTAKRVAEELNVAFGAAGHVGYQIRYDADHVGDATRIKFMTDGILLKEIQQDFLLRRYSVLLLDEAHERNVNTDILIGLLSRIAPLRAQMARAELEAFQLLAPDERAAAEQPVQPLKLVVMSATLRVEDFTQNQRLFPTPPPVLRVSARQYPVTVHFNKRTELDNYVDEAFKKVVKIHKKLPDGGVLVFLTGQREILQLCRKLRRAYSAASRDKQQRKQQQRQQRASEPREPRTEPVMAAPLPAAARPSGTDRVLREHDDIEEEGDLEDEEMYGGDDKAAYDLEADGGGSDDDSDEYSDDDNDDELAVPFMHVLPLYSLLPNDEQMRVFDAPPDGHRLERVFDLSNGISSFDIQWISKASADQRAGRAGRTGPGHCYRLYSSAVFDTEFPQFSAPEILCQPIEDLVLQMKAMGIHNVLQFPFPTPPDRQAVKMALHSLANLGAITGGEAEAITALGHVLVRFPVAARFAKMLLLAKELGVLEYTIAIVAGLSGHSPFVLAADRRERTKDDNDDDGDNNSDDKATKKTEQEDDMEREWREAEELRKHAQWVDPESDVLGLLRAAGAYAFAGASGAFCEANHLHEKTMQNMLKLRQQLTRIVNALFAGEPAFAAVALSPSLPPPDDETQVVLRQIVAAGFLDQVAKRVPPGTITDGSKIERNCAYVAATGAVTEPVYIHPHSAVFSPNPAKLPSFVVYQHIMRTSRAYMKMVTAVEPGWLASIGKGTPLCKYSAPLAEPAPWYDPVLDQVQCYAKAQFGAHQWALPAVQIAFPERDELAEKDGLAGKYRWFAKFLLDGAVVPGLKPFAAALREPSHMLIRKKFDKKIQLLVAKLQARRLKAWIRDDHHALLSKAWTAIVKQETAASS